MGKNLPETWAAALNQVYCIPAGIQESYQNDTENIEFFDFMPSRKFDKCHLVSFCAIEDSRFSDMN